MNSIETNELGASLLETLQVSDLSGVPGDIMDAFAGFPIASTLTKLSKGATNIRDYLLAKKIIRLVKQVAIMSSAKREQAMAELLATPRDRERFSEQLLLALERLDDMRKASITGNLSVGLMREEISLQEFWRMTRAIEAISLDEEWPILLVIAEYKERFYADDKERDSQWTHEGVLLGMVNDQLHLDISDGDLRSIVIRINQTGLFGMLGWRNGPAHDCEMAPWFFKLKPFMIW